MQFYSGTNPKGNAYTISTTNSVRTLSIGTWTRQELDNVSIKFYVQRNTGSTSSSIYLRPYGADLTVNYTWDEYFYLITTSSTSQGVIISASENETTGGGTNTITLTNVSSLSAIQLIDNGNDVTSSLVASGSNYIYTLSNVSADHTIVVSDVQQQTSSLYRKTNSWSQYTKVYKKTNNSWVQQTISLDLFDGNKIIVSG